MIFPGFLGALSFFQVFQEMWEPCKGISDLKNRFVLALDKDYDHRLKYLKSPYTSW